MKTRSKLEKENVKTQIFSLTAPAAGSVQLVGDFTQWQQKPIEMQKNADGIWYARVQLEPGLHHYRFLVDGEWWDDQKCTRHSLNPFGGQDAVRVVPEAIQNPTRTGAQLKNQAYAVGANADQQER